MGSRNLVDLLRRNRSSALIDGICLGIGFIFIIFGIAIPLVLRTTEQTIIGLLAIIGGILVCVVGGIVEVYNWAKLPQERSQELEERKWSGLLLRCEKCDKKTAHVLVKGVKVESGEIEEAYECLQCGETKKIYELTSAVS